MPSRREVMKMAVAAVLAGAASGSTQAGRSEPIPPGDHFDGRRFFNPGGEGPRGFRDLLRWRLSGERAEWPARFPSPFPPDRPPAKVERGLRIVLVGHSSFLVQGAGLNVLLDPAQITAVALTGGAPVRHVQAAIMRDQRAPAARAAIATLRPPKPRSP